MKKSSRSFGKDNELYKTLSYTAESYSSTGEPIFGVNSAFAEGVPTTLTRQLTPEAKERGPVALKRAVRFSCLVAIFCLVAFLPTAALAAYHQGDRGDDIAEIQQQLMALGYGVQAADGVFGRETALAIKAFQRDRGMEVDGVIGEETFRTLMGRTIPVSRAGSASFTRRVISLALQYEGVPYSFGGTTPNGFDCSGFTRYVFARAGLALPRTADAQYNIGTPVSIQRLQPGDLVFFSTYEAGASHVGIYLGDGEFVSATSSRGIAVTSLYSGYWGDRYIGARRVE